MSWRFLCRRFDTNYNFNFTILTISPEIVVTGDGSPSVVHPEMGVLYHSTHGALAESRHVFIESGLSYFLSKHNTNSVRIFEMGFGTGLNALLALQYCQQHSVSLSYVGIEKYPIDLATIEKLKLRDVLPISQDQLTFLLTLHEKGVVKDVNGYVSYEAQILTGDLLSTSLDEGKFDLIFFDAFGPRTQADLWSAETMKKMLDTLKSGGILTTFCAQGQFRRNLKAVGFEVEKIPGPPGKRDMTRAIKPQ